MPERKLFFFFPSRLLLEQVTEAERGAAALQHTGASTHQIIKGPLTSLCSRSKWESVAWIGLIFLSQDNLGVCRGRGCVPFCMERRVSWVLK